MEANANPLDATQLPPCGLVVPNNTGIPHKVAMVLGKLDKTDDEPWWVVGGLWRSSRGRRGSLII